MKLFKKLALLACGTLFSFSLFAGINAYSVNADSEAKILKINVAAVNGATNSEPWYNLRFLFDDQVIPKDDFVTHAELQREFPEIGDKIYLNGYSLNTINKESVLDAGLDMNVAPNVKIHWEANGSLSSGKGLLRIDVRKEWFNHIASPAVCGKFDFEFESGIVSPAGNILPQTAVSPTVEANDTMMNYMVLPSQKETPTEEIGIKSISSVQVPDAENYAFNIIFTDDVVVSDSPTYNQWNNLYIGNKVLVNGMSIMDIKEKSVNQNGQKFGDAIDLHWFVDDQSPNGRLSLYIKRDILNKWKFEFDDGDTLEFLEGFRTANNQVLTQSVCYTYYSNYGAWLLEGGEEETNYRINGQVIGDYVFADISGLKQPSKEQVKNATIDLGGILLNGAELPEGAQVKYAYKNAEYLLRIILPVDSMKEEGQDVITLKEGFSFAGGSELEKSVELLMNNEVYMGSSYLEYDCLLKELSGFEVESSGKKLTVSFGEQILVDGEDYTCENGTFLFAKEFLEKLPLGISMIEFSTDNGSVLFPVRIKDPLAKLTGSSTINYYYRSNENLQIYLDRRDAGYIRSFTIDGQTVHGKHLTENGLGVLIGKSYLNELTLGEKKIVISFANNKLEITLNVLDGRPTLSILPSSQKNELRVKVDGFGAEITEVTVNGSLLKASEYTVEEDVVIFGEKALNKMKKGENEVCVTTDFGSSTVCILKQAASGSSNGCSSSCSGGAIFVAITGLCALWIKNKKGKEKE